MTHLGDFGVERPAHEDSFGYFGETVRVNPDLSDLAMVDFVETGVAIQAMDGKGGLLALKDMLRSLVHPEDFDRLWELAKANRQQIDDLDALAEAIVVSVTGRPTEQPSDSSDGLPTTPDDSSSRALRLLDGRPDLQMAIVRAQEAQAS